MYDSQPTVNRDRGGYLGGRKVNPHEPTTRSFEIGQVSYKVNVFKSGSPRRISSTLYCSEEAKSVVLKNKAPRWHEYLECWCLNFHGRVTVASVKNFQLVAGRRGYVGDEETVLLQFGKVGDDLFTMDFREPLSAFQAFAICLTSFGTKIACE